MVLYKVGFTFQVCFAIILSVFVFLVAMAFIVSVKYADKSIMKNKLILQIRKSERIEGLIFVLFICLYLIYNSARAEFVPIYKFVTNDYTIVEGYVENFTEPLKESDYESFTVNDVEFKYQYQTLNNKGYYKTKKNGGVITGDGQHLKIGYYSQNNQNYIVYIEQLE